jgi:DNA gyrase subunit B
MAKVAVKAAPRKPIKTVTTSAPRKPVKQVDMPAVATAKKSRAYDASSIVWLKTDREKLRAHPTLYIGGNDATSVRHLAAELIANVMDEAGVGFGNKLVFTVRADGTVIVEDNARGVPVAPHPSNPKMSAAEIAFTQLHAGAKSTAGSSYDTSGGVHGIGAAAVTALSTLLMLDIKRDGKLHHAEFKAGVTTKRLKVVGRVPKGETGTKVTYRYDPEIFKGVKPSDVDWQPTLDWLEMLAYINPRMAFHVDIAPLKVKKVIQHKKGLADWLAHNLQDREPLGKPFVINTASADIALQWADSGSELSMSYVSGIRTVDGGTHVKGIEKAISDAIGKHATTKGDYAKNYRPEDLRAGMLSLVSVKIKSPKFSSQTKEKLVSPEAEKLVYDSVIKEITTFFDKNKSLARAIIKKANELASMYADYKLSAKAASALGTKRGTNGLPSKLRNSRSNKPEECELFLVEGDSAGGSAKQASDVQFQQILPLRGKVSNILKGKPETTLLNNEVQAILRSIGYDPKNKNGPLAKRRVGKVVLLVDADVDGKHIANLLLVLLWKIVPDLIREGRVYVVSDALFQAKSGAKTVFAGTRQEAINLLGAKNPTVTRVKGWGEINVPDMRPLVFKPDTRKLIQITPEGADRLIQVMGNDVAPRKRLLGVA